MEPRKKKERKTERKKEGRRKGGEGCDLVVKYLLEALGSVPSTETPGEWEVATTRIPF